MSENLTPEVLADLKAKSLGEKLAVAAANDAGLSAAWSTCRDDVKAEFERIALAFAASLTHDETATATIQALTARAEKAEQALTAQQQENERLREVMAGCADALKIEARANEMSANIMRDPVRTGGWSGAENTARAFGRHGLKAAGIRATLLSALQAPHSQGGEDHVV